MALIKTTVKLIVKEHSLKKFSGPVLALGVPEIYATYFELDTWIREFTGQGCPVAPDHVNMTTNLVGNRLGWVRADTFFEALNLPEVVTLDIPGCEHPPDIIHNLNDPFPSNLNNRFGLIVDPGTTEHIFDMKTCFSNIVRALKIGGAVIHQVPIYSYNGGYFSMNPNVFYDFYALNNFSRFKTYIILWDRYRPYAGRYRCYEYSPEFLGDRHSLADRDQCRYTPHLLFFALKTADTKIIKSPTQATSFLVSGSKDTDREGIAKRILKKIYHLILSLLPFHWAFYINAKATREITLLRIHRESFKV